MNSKHTQTTRLKTHVYSTFNRSQSKLISESCLAIFKSMKVAKPKTKHTQMHAQTWDYSSAGETSAPCFYSPFN